MVREWESRGVNAADFKGLLQRRMELVDDPSWVIEQLNLDGYGGGLGKRGGTQLVNGYGAFTTAAGTGTVIPVSDGSGFVNGAVSIGGLARTITGHSATTITVSVAVTYALEAEVLQTFPLTSRIDHLLSAQFRNGDQHLFAIADGLPLEVTASATPTGLSGGVFFPQTTTTGVWSTTTGALTSVQGLTIGDWVNVGSDNAQVTSITPATGVIVVAPALSGAPVAGTPVIFMPTRVQPEMPGDADAVQYMNLTHIFHGPRTGGVVPIPPTVVRQNPGTGVIRSQRHGVKPPNRPIGADVAAANTGGATLAPGTYGVRARFYNPELGQESEGSPEVVVTFAGPNNSIQVVVHGSPDPQVSQIRLYRTTNGGGGQWFRVPSVLIAGTPNTVITNPGGGATLTVVIYIGDANGGTGDQMRDLLDLTIPDTVVHATIWPEANRLVGIDTTTNTVVFSDQPDLRTGFLKGMAWPINNQIFVSYDDGDKLVAIVPFADSLLVFKRHSIWRITGIPPELTIQPVVYRADMTGVGARSRKTIVTDKDDVVFLGNDAVYRMNRLTGLGDGFESRRISLPIDERVNFNLDTTALLNLHAVFFRQKRQLRLWMQPSAVLVLQFIDEGDSPGWGVWVLVPPAGLSSAVTASAVAERDGAPIRADVGAGVDGVCFIATQDGLILQMDTALTDFGCAAYTTGFGPSIFMPAGRGMSARVRGLDLYLGVRNPVTLTVEFRTDQLVTPVSLSVGPITGGPALAASATHFSEVLTPNDQTIGMLVVAPGEKHRWRFTETSKTSMYRLLGWNYLYQALTSAAVKRPYLQTTLENVQ